jgi:restriction system protein
LQTHIWVLQDKAIDGILDAMAIMRHRLNKDSGPDMGIQSLRSLTSRELEYLVAVLWDKLGYAVLVTPATRDGGRDVEASLDTPGQRLMTFIETKQWTARVDVGVVRDLLGVLTDERTAKGVVVAPGGFTKGPDSATELAERNPRIELVDGHTLSDMLADNFGENWFLRIDRLVQDFRAVMRSQASS